MNGPHLTLSHLSLFSFFFLSFLFFILPWILSLFFTFLLSLFAVMSSPLCGHSFVSLVSHSSPLLSLLPSEIKVYHFDKS